MTLTWCLRLLTCWSRFPTFAAKKPDDEDQAGGDRSERHDQREAPPKAGPCHRREGRWLVLERSSDTVPDVVGRDRRGVADGVAQQGRDLAVGGELRAAPRAGGEVVVDLLSLVRIERVERIDTEHFLDLVVRHGCSPFRPSPETVSWLCMRFNPLRILLFTVPSGSPRIVATSR